jgi:hypothetical protein
MMKGHELETLSDFFALIDPGKNYPAWREAAHTAFFQGALCMAVLAIRAGREDEAAFGRLLGELRGYGLDELLDSLDARSAPLN